MTRKSAPFGNRDFDVRVVGRDLAATEAALVQIPFANTVFVIGAIKATIQVQSGAT